MCKWVTRRGNSYVTSKVICRVSDDWGFPECLYSLFHVIALSETHSYILNDIMVPGNMLKIYRQCHHYADSLPAVVSCNQEKIQENQILALFVSRSDTLRQCVKFQREFYIGN